MRNLGFLLGTVGPLVLLIGFSNAPAPGDAHSATGTEGFEKSVGPSLDPSSHTSLCSASGSRSNVDFLSASRPESVHLRSWS